MSAKAVREYDGKLLLAHWLHRAPIPSTDASGSEPSGASKFIQPTTRLAHISVDTSLLAKDKVQFDQSVRSTLDQLEISHPWLLTHKLVAKPDQLIKRRGKSGLLLLNADWTQAKAWIESHAGKDVHVRSLFVLFSFFFSPSFACGASFLLPGKGSGLRAIYFFLLCVFIAWHRTKEEGSLDSFFVSCSVHCSVGCPSC
jgi:ATP citrate (pro-S)-lyase